MASQVTILEAAMPPMITPSILAMEKNLDPALASLLIAVGIPLGLATTGAWYWWLG